jgi:S1-C subfamily serine protease
MEIEDLPAFDEPAGTIETGFGGDSRSDSANDFESLQEVTLDLSSGAQLAMKLKMQEPSASLQPAGLLVSSVTEGGLAASSGIIAGDIVQRINGEDVTAISSMVIVGRLIRGAERLTLSMVRYPER